MSVDYSEAEIRVMDHVMADRRPPLMTPAQFQRAAKVTAFALFGNGQGVVIRLRAGDTIQNFSLNPVVAEYLAAAIAEAGRTAAWKIGGDLLHPDAEDHGLANPDPDA